MKPIKLTISEGFDVPLFVESLFVNGAAGGFSADLLITLFVFWAWSFTDARERQISNWWWVVPAGFTVGMSLALPLYLYLRENAKSSSR